MGSWGQGSRSHDEIRILEFLFGGHEDGAGQENIKLHTQGDHFGMKCRVSCDLATETTAAVKGTRAGPCSVAAIWEEGLE